MAKRTASEVCIEYALAVAAVRVQREILRDNPCPHDSRWKVGGDVINVGTDPSCLDDYFESVKDGCDPDGDALDELCDACKIRLAAIEERREAKKRLGAAKRSVEAIGKRLNTEEAHG